MITDKLIPEDVFPRASGSVVAIFKISSVVCCVSDVCPRTPVVAVVCCCVSDVTASVDAPVVLIAGVPSVCAVVMRLSVVMITSVVGFKGPTVVVNSGLMVGNSGVMTGGEVVITSIYSR